MPSHDIKFIVFVLISESISATHAAQWGYRILPNKGAGRSHKVIPICMRSFLPFQRLFMIENRTIIKETTAILVIFDNIVFLQTMEGALIMGGALNRQITVIHLNALPNLVLCT